MTAFVNELCIGCGLCASTCPDVFHMNGSGVAEASGPVPGPQQSLAQSAAEACPVSAIELNG